MTKMTAGPTPEAKGFRFLDYIKITMLGFALSALWNSLHTIVLPTRLLDIVDPSLKNTYLGYLTFAGLVVAMAVQPVAAALSDRSGFRWGRRRPYILLGIILAIIFLPGLALSHSYIAIFIAYCLLQVSTNTAQGPYQGFIPDLAPPNKRGVASGVKSVLEILGGVILIRLLAYLMQHYAVGGKGLWLWLGLGILALVLLAAMLATILMIKEPPGTGSGKLSLLSTLYRSFKIDIKVNRDFVWFLLSRGLMGIPSIILLTFALYFIMDVISVARPVAVTADLLIVVGVSLLLAAYPAARLSDSIGRKPVVVFSGFIGALGIVLLFFSQDYVQLMLSAALIGIANGAFLSTSWALATDLVASGEEARYLALTSLAMSGGSALARLIGPVIDFFNGFSRNLGYSVMLLVCFVCFVASSLLLLKIKEPHQPR